MCREKQPMWLWGMKNDVEAKSSLSIKFNGEIKKKKKGAIPSVPWSGMENVGKV